MRTLLMAFSAAALGAASASAYEDGGDEDCVEVGETVDVGFDIPDLPADAEITAAEGMEMDPGPDDSLGAARRTGGQAFVRVVNIDGDLTSPESGEKGDGEAGEDDCWEIYVQITYRRIDFFDLVVGFDRWGLGIRISKRIYYYDYETVDTEVKVVCPC